MKDKKNIFLISLLVVFVSFCNSISIPQDKIASDSEMIWCVSNADYVRAGSTLIFTGWESVEFKDNGLKFTGLEATRAKDLYRTLYATVEYYEFIGIDLEEKAPISFNKQITLKNLEATWVEGKKNRTAFNNAADVIRNWPNLKEVYESTDKDNRDMWLPNYVNSYSICKLWYQANN
jgi:hypothetical protein